MEKKDRPAGFDTQFVESESISDPDSQFQLLENQSQTEPGIQEQTGSIESPGSLEDYGLYVLSYTCFLAPRFREHRLVGDLADYLHIWMKDICISYGWKLPFITIQPEYLHWGMVVNMPNYPAEFMNVICRETSKKIFADFPRLKQKNMSGEFWAPTFFVNVGRAPKGPDAVHFFLTQIRARQGV